MVCPQTQFPQLCGDIVPLPFFCLSRELSCHSLKQIHPRGCGLYICHLKYDGILGRGRQSYHIDCLSHQIYHYIETQNLYSKHYLMSIGTQHPTKHRVQVLTQRHSSYKYGIEQSAGHCGCFTLILFPSLSHRLWLYQFSEKSHHFILPGILKRKKFMNDAI